MKSKETISKPDFAWHYTTGWHFVQIVKSNVLLPATAYIARRELPIIWFSLEQFWEPTAQKAMNPLQLLGMNGTYLHGGGLIRFGISPSRLIPWPQLGRLARIPSRIMRSLERVARHQGARPELWCGTIDGPIALPDIEAIDCFDGNNWVRIKEDNGGTLPDESVIEDAGRNVCKRILRPDLDEQYHPSLG
jgi:hypothetical protein